MLRAKEAVISAQFFFAAVAWWTPNAISMCFVPNRTPWRSFAPCDTFPETAVIGRTLAARFAGACAASKTVTRPTTMPHPTPTGLNITTGIVSHSPPMPYRRTAQTVQLASVPSKRPSGMAVLHQFSASSRTNRIICALLAPMHRSIPKNWVRWATLLFMLPEIIRTPAASTSTNSTAAAS